MRTLITLLLASITFASSAQQKENLSKVKLKDGAQLNVLIIENIPGDHITVSIPGNDHTTIAYDKILSIKQNNFKYYSNYTPPKKWYWDGSFGFVFGQTTENGGPRAGFEVGATYNYRLFPLLSIGVGVETMAFFINNETVFIPVFGRLKGLLSEQRVTGFYALDYGYSFAIKTASSEAEGVHGGWYTRPTLGVQAANFSIGIGYQLQKVTTTKANSWWWGSDSQIVEERLMKNVVFITSFTF